MMHTISSTRGAGRFRQFLLTFVSLLVLACLSVACGSNASSTNGSGGTGSSTSPSPTAVKGYGTAQGCPSDVVVTTPPSTANVVVKFSNTKSTISAHVGDVIEIRLPFGQKWTGPTTSQSILELQQPSGYAWKADNVCVWRFLAKSSGTTQLNFHSQALCKPGEMCPMYIANVPFTITVQ